MKKPVRHERFRKGRVWCIYVNIVIAVIIVSKWYQQGGKELCMAEKSDIHL